VNNVQRPTDFAYELYRFFTTYLPNDRNYSKNTIASYNTTFNLFRIYCEEVQGISMDTFQIADMTDTLVEAFLTWVVAERGNSIATRNQRLAAIHSFFRFISRRNSRYLMQAQTIREIKPAKHGRANVPYLSFEEVQALLRQPALGKTNGLRDRMLLEFLYETAARVQEAADVRLQDIRFESPATVRINKGKGDKQRIVPLPAKVAARLKGYVERYRIPQGDYPLFFNRNGGALTRAGIAHILKKYADQIKQQGKVSLPDKISPHMLRHSKAVHLLQAGVNLVYIRDILGHEDVSSTQIYARADPNAKRKAIEAAFSDTPLDIDDSVAPWQKDTQLLSWLMRLGADVD